MTNTIAIKNATAFIIESINDDNATLAQIKMLHDYDIREFADDYHFTLESFKIAMLAIDEFLAKTQR